ncbi:uncharacterized protein LOC144307714 [Canis aureus]
MFMRRHLVIYTCAVILQSKAAFKHQLSEDSKYLVTRKKEYKVIMMGFLIKVPGFLTTLKSLLAQYATHCRIFKSSKLWHLHPRNGNIYSTWMMEELQLHLPTIMPGRE